LKTDFEDFEDEFGNKIDNTIYFDRLYEFFTKLMNESCHKVSEAYGLYKIGGHPLVDPRNAITKLLKTTRSY
jgi:hypothetical protein